jgi:hypothetical protein
VEEVIHLGGDNFYLEPDEELVRSQDLEAFLLENEGQVVLEYDPYVTGVPHMLSSRVVWVRRRNADWLERLVYRLKVWWGLLWR